MTGGPRNIEWYDRVGRFLDSESVVYHERHHEAVRIPNQLAALALAKRLRTAGATVVEPVTFVRPSWSQSDFYFFWGEVIRRFVDRVIFMDGWESSRGCVWEFYTATSKHIRTENEAGAVISCADAINRIRHQIQKVRNSKDARYFKIAINELEGL